jgi:hypothetical protein
LKFKSLTSFSDTAPTGSFPKLAAMLSITSCRHCEILAPALTSEASQWLLESAPSSSLSLFKYFLHCGRCFFNIV